MKVIEELSLDLWKREEARYKERKGYKATLITIHPRLFDQLAHECDRGELSLKSANDIEFRGVPIIRDPKVDKWEISFEPLEFLLEKERNRGTK